jgi:DNA-binding NtrC family response regulator
MELLEHYSFPGNIRELKNILQKAISLSTSGLITPDLLKFDDIENIYHGNPVADRRTTRGARKTPPSTNRSISEIEATHIESLLHQYKGHRAKVAEVLDISARTLYRKLKQYNLTRVGKQHT